MEFWGVEVKPGQTVKCEPGGDRYLHVSQAALGETKKDKLSENVPVFVNFNNKKIVLGTLSGDKFPQISYDLVFESDFELSHSSKSTSVFFCGYKTLTESPFLDFATQENSDFGSDSDDVELDEVKNDIILEQKANGKPKLEKPISGKGEGSAAKAEGSAKSKGKTGELKPKPEDDDVSEEDDSDSDDDEEMADLGDDSDEDDESSDEEDEAATPKKAEISKKRAADSATKTPVPEKKAKLVSPVGSQKTGGDGKTGGHTATPHPAKQAGKTSANKSPKSAGSVACKSCSKTFNSDNALQAHTKAKHA